MCPEIELQDGEAACPPSDRLLDYLFAPEVDRRREAFVERYREVTAAADTISVAPAEPTILGKLIWPLRQAKGSYALGNYLGCIALCGMVGEMVAILLWDISKVDLHGKPMTEDDQRSILGNTFERLGQERRVDVLRSLNLIDDDAKSAFASLRGIRRQYLHLLSKAHSQATTDARQAYKNAVQVVALVLGQTFRDGAVVLRGDLMTYLTEKGIVGQ
jgi:hypothetical protein